MLNLTLSREQASILLAALTESDKHFAGSPISEIVVQLGVKMDLLDKQLHITPVLWRALRACYQRGSGYYEALIADPATTADSRSELQTEQADAGKAMAMIAATLHTL
jgi:hypothetical protein